MLSQDSVAMAAKLRSEGGKAVTLRRIHNERH